MPRRGYTSDLTDAEWRIFEARLEELRPTNRGRRSIIPKRDLMDAILYRLRTGCQWRDLPHDFPDWQTVYSLFRTWKRQGLWQKLHDSLCPDVRAVAGRDPEPSALIIDSQSVKANAIVEDSGYVVVDPKGSDYAKYAGATLVTPNRKELSEASGKTLRTEQEIIAAAETVIRDCGIERVLVTRSEEGMTLVSGDGASEPPLMFASMAREVADISGAGDTVVAAIAACLATGEPLSLGMKLATLAAGVVVGKLGTAVASPEEIMALARSMQSIL